MSADFLILLDHAPAPDLADLCTSVKVEQSLSEPTRYTIRLVVELNDLGEYDPLTDIRLRPGAELAILVTDGQADACLVSGPIDRHQVHIETGGPGSWLEISGGDRRVQMARAHQTKAWPGFDSDIVTTILASHALRPNVAKTLYLHSADNHTQNQCGSDLDFLNRLARRNGFQFWISYDVVGFGVRGVGNFKPSPPRPDVPAVPPVIDPFGSELEINIGDRSGQTMLSIDIDADFDRPILSTGLRVAESLNAVVPGGAKSPVTLPLGVQPLASFTSSVPREVSLATAGDATELTARAKAALSEAEWFVQARVHTTKFALAERIVQPHMLVPIRGLGRRYSGQYFVTAVTHTLDMSSHVMDVTLARNALGA